MRSLHTSILGLLVFAKVACSLLLMDGGTAAKEIFAIQIVNTLFSAWIVRQNAV